ncbi:MAG: hypothetical protein R8K22_02765 [Mariprofundaceae bacterium]
MNHFCKHASKLTSDTFERPLSWKESISLRIHLMMCRMCREDTQNIQLLSRLFQIIRSDQNTTSELQLPKESHERIRQHLHEKHQEKI